MAKKILVVDDEPDVLNLIKLILKSAGYKVTTAENGDECLNILKKNNFDLITLDVMMPGLSGWEVFKKIKKMDKKAKIVFLSVVKISEERKKELIKEGAIGYIVKPFTKKELLSKIKAALG